ncbi:transposase [Streptomyces sp. NPDC005533]
MVMKNYPPEFKADAVALYESRPGATIRQIAAGLGVNPKNPAELDQVLQP